MADDTNRSGGLAQGAESSGSGAYSPNFEELISKINAGIGRLAARPVDDPAVWGAMAKGFSTPEGNPNGNFVVGLGNAMGAMGAASQAHNQLTAVTPEMLAKNYDTAQNVGYNNMRGSSAMIPGSQGYQGGQAIAGALPAGSPAMARAGAYAPPATVGSADVSPGVSAWSDHIDSAAKAYNLNPNILRAVMSQESGGKPSVVSPKGARGLMQIMPGTFQDRLAENPTLFSKGIDDPGTNVMAGAAELRSHLNRYNGDLRKALGAYNAGPARMDAVLAGTAGLPGETQAYIPSVLSMYQKLAGGTQPVIQGGASQSASGLPPGVADASSAARAQMLAAGSPMLGFANKAGTGAELMKASQAGLDSKLVQGSDGRLYPNAALPAAEAGVEFAKTQAALPAQKDLETHKVATTAMVDSVPTKTPGGAEVNVPKAVISQGPEAVAAFLARATPAPSADAASGMPIPPPPAGGVGQTTVGKALAEGAGKDIMDLGSRADSATKLQTSVRFALQNLEKFPTNAFGETRREAGSLLIGMGADPDYVNSHLGNVSSGELLMKEFFKIAADRTRELGAREPGFVLQAFQRASPNLELLTNTNKMMLNLFDQDAQRTRDMNTAAAKWIKAGNSDLSEFQSWFDRNNPPEKYIVNAYKASGEDPILVPGTAAGKTMYDTLQNGDTYTLPNGKRHQKVVK